MRANSLALRLFLSATAWTVVILLVTGFALSGLYRDSVERGFDRRLGVYLKTLIADIASPEIPIEKTGQMLGEQSAALGWLADRPHVDRSRIGVFGISMGATLGYFLAAADRRPACIAQLCCFADLGRLIQTGAHDLHGIYLTIPGLLERTSSGEIAGLVAPRPQLICIGDLDPLTPPAAVDPALAAARAAYAAAGVPDRLLVHREAATGHAESPAMRKAVLAFFARHLAPGAG